MTRRFQIEDLIHQDASGVVFRAVDKESGRMVALRRFFPFGARGDGLLGEEQAAYGIALGRLAGLQHPALRAVVSGGCDPVDGIPFIATEWIEGAVLGPIVSQRPLPADAAVLLLTQALEVCELLSQVLAEEAVWVETALDTIVLGNEESGRGFTFWISPMKWLGGDDHPRGLESIIALTEEIMGWKDQSVNGEAGRGLGAWLRWLRKAAPTTTFREVRENLATAIGSEPPAEAKTLVSEAIRPPPRKSSKITVLGGFGLVLILTGIGGWLLTRNRSMPEMPDLTTLSAEDALAAQREAVEKRSGVFTPAESGLLVTHKGRNATLKGRLAKTGFSDSGKTLYLYFSDNPSSSEARGAALIKEAGDLDLESLAPLVGKKVRLTGKVKLNNGRPEIEITGRAAIEAAE